MAKKKKNKINYRLLSIVGALVVVAAGVVGGLLYLRMTGSSERNLREANAFFEAGDFEKAYSFYGRVVYKQPGNMEALGKLILCYEKLQPDTPETANELYLSFLQAMKQAARYAPVEDREQRQSDLLEEYYRAAVLTNQDLFWRLLRETADEYISRAEDPTSSVVARSHFYRGLSDLRMNDENLTSDIDGMGNIRFPGEDDLERFVELESESDLGWAKLAFGRMAVARRLGLESRFAQEERNLQVARETFDKARELNPQGIWTNLELLRDGYVEKLWYIGKNVRDPGSVSPEQIASITDQVDETLDRTETLIAANAIDDQMAVLDLVQFLRLIDGFDGQARSAAILEKALEVDPGNHRMRYELGRSQYAIGDYEDATATARSTMDAQLSGVSLRARDQWLYRILATKLAFDAQNRIFRGTEGAARQSAYEEMKALRAELAEQVVAADDNPVLKEVDGRIALADRRWLNAVSLLEQALAAGDGKDSDVLRAVAQALEQNGQTGLAQRRLEEAIEAAPNDLRNYLALAELLGRQGQPAKGIDVLKTLPARLLEENDSVRTSYELLQLMAAAGTDGELPDDILDPSLRVLGEADQLISQDQYDAAVELLNTYRASLPEDRDIRILTAQAFVESLRGRNEEAVALVDLALAVDPENEALQLARLRYGDPIEGIIQYCTDRYLNPDERSTMIYTNLSRLADRQEDQAEEAERRGETEVAATSRDLVARARAAQAEYQAAAESAVDSVPAAFIDRLERHLSDRNFEAAKAMLPMAREKNFDSAQGNLAEARVEIAIADGMGSESPDYEATVKRAAAAAKRATEISPYADLAWRTLGVSEEMSGNLTEAERAYAEAFRLNPSSAETLSKQAFLLLDNEEEWPRLLTLLRENAPRFSADAQIRDLWLESEASFGDPGVAITERMRAWRDDPDDRPNAIRLAATLARLQPARELILDDEGRGLISARQWFGLSAPRQAELLNETQENWNAIMDSVLQRVAASPDDNFQEALLHARVHADRQQIGESIKVLRRFLREQAPEDQRPRLARQAAQFLVEEQRVDEAIAVLEEAREYQSEKKLVDASIGSLYYMVGEYETAIPYLAAAVDVTESTSYRQRLVESYLRSQRFEEGRKELEALRAAGGSDYEVAMLEGFLAYRESILAGASGDAAAESAANLRYRRHLQDAISLNPDQPRPYELLVNDLLADFVLSQDPEILAQAERTLETASPSARRSETLMLASADVQEARNNIRRSILDMQEYLRAVPAAARVRQRLIRAHIDSGSPENAMDTIQAAIVLEPESAFWYEVLGRFHDDAGRPSEASKAYIEAFDREPSQRILVRLSDATRSAEDWDHEGVLALVQKNERLLESDAILQSINAKALARVGAEVQAKAKIEKAFDTYRQNIELNLIPREAMWRWYEDLQAVFAQEDPESGAAFARSLIDGNPGIDDLAGLARYWALWDSPEASMKAIQLQREAMELALQQDSDRHLTMLSRLAALQLELGFEEESIATYRKIVEETPDDTMALNNYAFLLATVLGRPQEAMPFAEKAIVGAPDNPAVIDTMATLQAMVGDHQASLTGRLKQLEFQPKDPELLGTIALLYADHMEDPSSGMAFAERAVGRRPRDASLMDIKGWVYFKTGDTARAEDLILESIRRQPTFRAHLHLAELYLEQGRDQKARQQLLLAEEIADEESQRESIEKLKGRLGSG